MLLYEFAGFGLEGPFRAGLGARRPRRICARLARRLPGDRIARTRRKARRQAAGAADRGRFPTAPSVRLAASPPGSARPVGQDQGRKCKPGQAAILSGASGADPATGEERAFLTAHGELAVRATGTYLGHGMEAQFPMNVALAALAVGHGSLFPPCDARAGTADAGGLAAGRGHRRRALARRRPGAGRTGRLKESGT